MKYNIKQYIVINKAAKWTAGKYASQVAHASMAVMFQYLKRGFTRGVHFEGNITYEQVHYEMDVPIDIDAWIQGSFAKIILKDEGILGIYDLEDHAKQLGIPTALIKDSGVTQELEDNEQGQTLAIGPFDTDNPKYEPLMKHLSKLRLY